MGMFDSVECDYPLPDGLNKENFVPAHEGDYFSFQTKAFDCLLDWYKITEDGRLHIADYDIDPGGGRRTDWEEYTDHRGRPFHGQFNFYTSSGKKKDGTYKWHEYVAIFNHGQLEEIIDDSERVSKIFATMEANFKHQEADKRQSTG